MSEQRKYEVLMVGSEPIKPHACLLPDPVMAGSILRCHCGRHWESVASGSGRGRWERISARAARRAVRRAQRAALKALKR